MVETVDFRSVTSTRRRWPFLGSSAREFAEQLYTFSPLLTFEIAGPPQPPAPPSPPAPPAPPPSPPAPPPSPPSPPSPRRRLRIHRLHHCLHTCHLLHQFSRLSVRPIWLVEVHPQFRYVRAALGCPLRGRRFRLRGPTAAPLASSGRLRPGQGGLSPRSAAACDLWLRQHLLWAFRWLPRRWRLLGRRRCTWIATS